MDRIDCEYCDSEIEWGTHWHPVQFRDGGLSVLCGGCEEAQGRLVLRIKRECREETVGKKE